MKHDITAILEGAESDTPKIMQYFEVNGIYVPSNASTVLIKDVKLHLYGSSVDFDYTKFTRVAVNKDYKGWELVDQNNKRNPNWLGWVFSMPRSLLTREGRVYLNEIFYQPKWEYYFPLIPTILEDGKQIFNNETTAETLNRLKKPAF